jgi:hypothetical protein
MLFVATFECSESSTASRIRMTDRSFLTAERQLAASLDSHCSPVSGTSQGSAYLSDGLDQPPSDYLTRIRLLGQYASAIVELVKEEVNLSAW